MICLISAKAITFFKLRIEIILKIFLAIKFEAITLQSKYGLEPLANQEKNWENIYLTLRDSDNETGFMVNGVQLSLNEDDFKVFVSQRINSNKNIINGNN